MVLDTGKSRIGGQQYQFLVRALFLVCRHAFLLYERKGDLLPLMRALIHLPKAQTPNTITLGVRFSTYKFGGYTTMQYIPYPMNPRSFLQISSNYLRPHQ